MESYADQLKKVTDEIRRCDDDFIDAEEMWPAYWGWDMTRERMARLRALFRWGEAVIEANQNTFDDLGQLQPHLGVFEAQKQYMLKLEKSWEEKYVQPRNAAWERENPEPVEG